MSTPVVAYCRISNDHEGAGLGVARQAADCRDLAASLGLGEPEIITDNDMSAYTGRRRPGYERLLSGLGERKWSTVLAWHVDRLTRSPKDLETLVDVLNAAGAALHTVKGGRVDLTTAEGRLQARILGSLARYESEHRSDRIRRKMREIAEAGRPNGGARPYGYEADQLSPRPDEALIVLELTRRIIEGEKPYSLARDLRTRGVPTPRGGAWSPSIVRTLVLRHRNAGLRATGTRTAAPVVVAEAQWPAIVPRDAWEAARAILTDPTRRTNPKGGNAPSTLLSGIARCACGGTVQAGGSRKDGPRYYRCGADGCYIKRRADLVEDVAVGLTLAWLERERVAAEPPVEPGRDDPRAQADALRAQMERLEDMSVTGEISRDGYRRNRDRILGDLAALERAEALLRVPSPVEGVTAAAWKDLPLDRRRAIVDYLWIVTVLPLGRGRHAGPESIDIKPKAQA